MAKNYESESKNSRNYTGTSDKNSYGNEMNHAGNAKNSVKSKNETDCRSKAKNKTAIMIPIRYHLFFINSYVSRSVFSISSTVGSAIFL